MSHRLLVAILGLAVCAPGCTLLDSVRTDHNMNHRAKKAWDRYENCYDDSPNADEVKNGFYDGYLQYVYNGCGNPPKCLPSRFGRPSYQTCFGKAKVQAYREGFQLGVEAATHDCQAAGSGARCSTGHCTTGHRGPTCATGRCRAGGPYAAHGSEYAGQAPSGHCATCEAGYPQGAPTEGSPYPPEGMWHGPPLSEGMIIPTTPYPSGDAKPNSELAPPPEPANDLPTPPKDPATPPKAPPANTPPAKDGATPPAAPATSLTVPYGTSEGFAPYASGTVGPEATFTTSPRSFGPRVIGPDEVLPDEDAGATTLPELTVPTDNASVPLNPPASLTAPGDSLAPPSSTVSPPPTSSARIPFEGWRPARRTLSDEVAPFPEAGRETLKR